MKYRPDLLVWLALSLSTAFAATDQVVLRDGRMLEGRILREQQDGYLFLPRDSATAQEQIPKHAVRFVLYGDPAQAARALGLDHPPAADSATATATIMPAEAFGEALGPLAQSATQSVWVAAYYISGYITGPIEEFYNTIRAKARSGVDVVLICEFSSGTRPAQRNATLNYAAELDRDGVTVLFIQGNKTMHKKMIIVDGKTVLLGSSNLTVAGTTGSNEMNVWIESPAFARRAAADFARLRAMAIPASELK
jgi:phosphatidylserine/phosphatidylglycerophosphate/cardiolipin synthase-like enzyme